LRERRHVDEVATFVVPSRTPFERKEIKDSLTRQGMQNKWGLHKEGRAGRERKERILIS